MADTPALELDDALWDEFHHVVTPSKAEGGGSGRLSAPMDGNCATG